MKQFMIRYQFKNGTKEDWHQEIARFISNIDGDPALKGKITYRCMKEKEGANYFHLATAADDLAIKALQGNDWFRHYTEKTREVAGGEVTVTPLEVIAETH